MIGTARRNQAQSAPAAASAIQAVLSSASNALAYWALNPRMRHAFTADGHAFVAYRNLGRVALAAGDPCGPRGDRQQAFELCGQQSRRQGRVPVLYQAALDGLELGSAWTARPLGDEALVDLESFSLAGKARGNIRRSYNRALEEGWTLQLFHNIIDDHALAGQAETLSQAWLNAKGGAEMGFSMGPFNCETPDCRWALAVDPDGVVQVVLSWVPNYGRHGWMLDVMRRAPQAAGFAMDFALVGSILHWQAQGCALVSLALAPLANHHGVGRGWWPKVMSWAAGRRWGGYHCRSLEAYKAKFADRWEPRYLVYPSRHLVAAVVATMRAHRSVTLHTPRLPWQVTAGAARLPMAA